MSFFLSSYNESSYDKIFLVIHNFIENFLFVKILYIPVIIVWIIFFGLFCTFKFKLVNIRLFKHAICILFGRGNYNKEVGIISHLQAFFTSISGTVGLGTISGVAIAITTGGPGSVIWMIIIGVLGMSIKFAEVTLSIKYRLGKGLNIFSGPFQYMKYGLAELGFVRTGKFLAFLYAIILIIAMSFGGIPFQANQTIAMFNYLFNDVNNIAISLLFAFLVGLVVLGGIKRIASITCNLVPSMTLLYITGCILIIMSNSERVFDTFSLMFHSMFNGSSISGGTFGALIAGVRRSVFANEAGIGTAAMAHGATCDGEPVRAGCVAMLEPFIDTILISFLTGIVIIISGSYDVLDSNIGDIVLASASFLGISSLFGYVIFPIIVFSFAFSTIITYSYYCEVSWKYIFGQKLNMFLCHIIIVILVFISCLSKNIVTISKLGDTLFMFLALPNSVAIFLLSKKVNQCIKDYIKNISNNSKTTI